VQLNVLHFDASPSLPTIKTDWNGKASRSLHSGFRLRAQKPANRLKFEALIASHDCIEQPLACQVDCNLAALPGLSDPS